MTNTRKYEDINAEEAKRIIGAVNDVFTEYEKLLNGIFDYCEPLGIVYDSSNRVLAYNLLFSKAIKTYYAIYNMCKEGYGSEAFIMFRSLMDIKINMKYLWNSDNCIGDRFIEHIDFLRYDYLMSRKKCPEDYDRLAKAAGNIKELEKKHNNFKSKYNNARKHYWSGMSTKQMIEKLPDNIRDAELNDYETIYRMCSFHVHSNIMALQKSISAEGIFRISPNLDDIESVFPIATLYILQIIDYWLACMDIPPNEDLKKSYDQFMQRFTGKFSPYKNSEGS